jgi:replicative DNA helicase
MNESTLLTNTTKSERLILASILLDNSLFELAAARLKPEYFQDELHKLVFRAMKSAHGRGAPLNPIVLAGEAKYVSNG